MKKYLKMADVFLNEMRVIGDSKNMLADDVGIIIGCYSGDKMAEYALHAINSHDELVEEVERLRSTLQQCVDALYIAYKFCGNHTADECGDEIAIPISDALVAASNIVAPPNLGVTND